MIDILSDEDGEYMRVYTRNINEVNVGRYGYDNYDTVFSTGIYTVPSREYIDILLQLCGLDKNDYPLQFISMLFGD